MSFLNKFESVMLKIFQIMNKINKFSNQMAELTSSPDYGKEKTKRKDKHKKHLDKLEQKKKRLQIEIDNIKKKRGSKKEKKKLRKKTAAEPEILGGFDCKGIGDRMMDEFQRPHKDETEEN